MRSVRTSRWCSDTSGQVLRCPLTNGEIRSSPFPSSLVLRGLHDRAGLFPRSSDSKTNVKPMPGCWRCVTSETQSSALVYYGSARFVRDDRSPFLECCRRQRAKRRRGRSSNATADARAPATRRAHHYASAVFVVADNRRGKTERPRRSSASEDQGARWRREDQMSAISDMRKAPWAPSEAATSRCSTMPCCTYGQRGWHREEES